MARANIPAAEKTLHGWGRTHSATCQVFRPVGLDELRDAHERCRQRGWTIGGRGHGCSYGDAATNHAGAVIDLTALDRIHSIDRSANLVTVEPGVAIGALVDKLLPDNLTVGAVPGGPQTTVGGLVSVNAHGKDSHAHGNFANSVEALKLLTAGGETITADRATNPDLFAAAVGGFGLLGLIVEVTLRVKRVPGPYVDVAYVPFSGFAALEELFRARAGDAGMSLAVLDAFSDGPRGYVEFANWTEEADGAVWRPVTARRPSLFGLPPNAPAYAVARALMSRPTMRLHNRVRFGGARSAATRRVLAFPYFNFPVIGVPEHARIFPGGCYEIQVFVPEDVAFAFFAGLHDRCRAARFESWLYSIKRHTSDAHPLSFAGDGYSISLDLPGRTVRTPAFRDFFAALSRETVAAGGRFNLSKDHLLDRDTFHSMYPRRDELEALKRTLDPDGLYTNDIYRRLF